MHRRTCDLLTLGVLMSCVRLPILYYRVSHLTRLTNALRRSETADGRDVLCCKVGVSFLMGRLINDPLQYFDRLTDLGNQNTRIQDTLATELRFRVSTIHSTWLISRLENCL